MVGGISTGALCLWALVMWQNVSVEELTGLLLNTLLMLGVIIVTALLIIVAFKGLAKIARFITNKLG